MKRLAWFLVVAVAPIVACAPEIEVWEGDHLDYEWEPPLQPCDGARERLDAYVPFVADQLGLDQGERSRITYSWLTPESYEAITRSRPSTGFALYRHAYSMLPLHYHEVVHTVVHQRRFGGLSFLNEGLAVAFDSSDIYFLHADSWGPLPRFDRVDPRPYLDHRLSRDGSGFYPPAGAFVAYLLSRHGPEKVLRLHERLDLAASPERFAEVFADVFGAPLDDEVATYLDDDTCPEEATVVPQPFACAAPVLPWVSPERWQDARAFACLDADADGLHDRRDASVSLEIPEDGLYRVDVVGDEWAAALLVPCGRCPWLAEDTYLKPGARVLTLTAGHHAINYDTGILEPGLVGVAITRVGDSP